MFHVKCANPECPEYFDTWDLRKKYHSAKCCERVRKQRKRVLNAKFRRVPTAIPGVCDICGKVLGISVRRSYCKGHHRAYCKKHGLVPRTMTDPRICPKCGVSFLPTRPQSLYCKNHTSHAKRTPLAPRKCAAKNCEIVFLPNRSTHRYHSAVCRRKGAGETRHSRRSAGRLREQDAMIYRTGVLAKGTLQLQEKGPPHDTHFRPKNLNT